MSSKARGGRGGGNHPNPNNARPPSVPNSQQPGVNGSSVSTNMSRGGGLRGAPLRADPPALPSDVRVPAKTENQREANNSKQGEEAGQSKASAGAPTFEKRSQVGQIIDSLISPKLVDVNLVFLPFFPEDNGAEPAAIINTAEVLKIAERGLDELLSMNLHRWVCTLTISSHCVLFPRFCTKR